MSVPSVPVGVDASCSPGFVALNGSQHLVPLTVAPCWSACRARCVTSALCLCDACRTSRGLRTRCFPLGVGPRCRLGPADAPFPSVHLPAADSDSAWPQPQLWCAGLLFSSGVSPREFGAAGSMRVCPSARPRLPLEELLAFVPTFRARHHPSQAAQAPGPALAIGAPGLSLTSLGPLG